MLQTHPVRRHISTIPLASPHAFLHRYKSDSRSDSAMMAIQKIGASVMQTVDQVAQSLRTSIVQYQKDAPWMGHWTVWMHVPEEWDYVYEVEQKLKDLCSAGYEMDALFLEENKNHGREAKFPHDWPVSTHGALVLRIWIDLDSEEADEGTATA